MHILSPIRLFSGELHLFALFLRRASLRVYEIVVKCLLCYTTHSQIYDFPLASALFFSDHLSLLLPAFAVELRVQREPVGDRAPARRPSHPQGIAEDPRKRARLHRGEGVTSLRLVSSKLGWVT